MIDHVINVDYFEGLFLGQIVEYDVPLDEYKFDQEKLILKRRNLGTRIFKYGYDMYYEGHHFGQLFCNPHNTAIIQERTIKFEIQNNVLYEIGWVARLEYIMQKVGLQMLNVSRIDIAVDGGNFFALADKIDKYEYVGKGKLATQSFKRNGKLLGMDIGSRKSKRWITIYNKSEEMSKSNKFYIRDMWERSNLKQYKMEEPIQRFELKLRNDAIKEFHDFEWTLLDNFEYLSSVFQSHLEKFIIKKPTGKDTNKSRWENVPWSEVFNFSSLGGEVLPMHEARKTNEVSRMKITIKTLYFIYLASGKDKKYEYYLDIARQMAVGINCLGWYINHFDRWETDYVRNSQHFEYLVDFETYKHGQQLILNLPDKSQLA